MVGVTLLLRFWNCKIWKHHKWTSRCEQGIKPTNFTLEGFLDYAEMYCERCGHISEYSKSFTREILINDLLKQTGVCKGSELK